MRSSTGRSEAASPPWLLPALVGLVAFIQTGKTLFYFRSLVHVFDVHPIYHIDYAVMTYQMEMGRRFFESTGRLWGYDPFHLAGMPLSFLWNSNVLLQLLAVWLDPLPPERVLKLFLFTVLVVEPFAIYGAVRNFGVARVPAVLSTLLLLLYLRTGQPMLFLSFGMLTGYLVYLFFLYGLSLVARLAREDVGLPFRAWLAVWLALSLLLHKTFLLLMLPACAALGLAWLRQRDAERLATLAGAWGFALAVNAFWILPSARLRGAVDFSFSPFWRTPELPLVSDLAVLKLAYPVSATLLTSLAILVLGVGGLRALARQGRRLEQRLLTCTLGFLAFLVFASPWLPLLEWVHGARFYVTIWIVLAIPAAVAVGSFWQRWSGRGIAAARGWALAATALAACFLPSYEGRALELFGESLPTFDFEDNAVLEENRALATWLREHAAPDENVFVEFGPHNAHLNALYRFQSGRRFISAPYQYVYLGHNYVNRYLHDFLGAKSEPHGDWPEPADFAYGKEDFEEVARFFNVRWWALHRAESKARLASVRDMELVHELGGYAIYRYAPEMSNFLAGSGALELGDGGIRIRDARASEGELIVKLHWLDGMRVEGAMTVEPYWYERFPLPFIRVLDPGPEVSIALE